MMTGDSVENRVNWSLNCLRLMGPLQDVILTLTIAVHTQVTRRVINQTGSYFCTLMLVGLYGMVPNATYEGLKAVGSESCRRRDEEENRKAMSAGVCLDVMNSFKLELLSFFFFFLEFPLV